MAEANQKYFSSMAEFLKVKGEKSCITSTWRGAPGRYWPEGHGGAPPQGAGVRRGWGCWQERRPRPAAVA